VESAIATDFGSGGQSTFPNAHGVTAWGWAIFQEVTPGRFVGGDASARSRSTNAPGYPIRGWIARSSRVSIPRAPEKAKRVSR